MKKGSRLASACLFPLISLLPLLSAGCREKPAPAAAAREAAPAAPAATKSSVAAAEGSGNPDSREAEREERAGHAAAAAGDPRRALGHFRAAIAARQRSGEKRWECSDRNFAGLALRRLQEPEAARQEFEKAERLAAEDLFLSGQAAALNNLGLLGQDEGDFGTARALYRRALRLLAPIDSAAIAGEVALYRENLARLLLIEGELDEARRLLQPPAGNRSPTASGLAELAWLLLLENRAQEALAVLDSALPLCREPLVESVVQDRRGTALERLGLLREAREAYLEALELARGRAPASTTAATLASLCRLEVLHPEAALGGNPPCKAAAAAAAGGGVPAATLASALYWQARQLEQGGSIGEAQVAARRAATMIGSLRADASSPERRSSFLEDRAAYFSLSIDLAMEAHRGRPEQGFERLALMDSEQWRARSLTEQIEQQRGGEPRGDELRQVRRQLRDKLAARDLRRRELWRRDTAESAALDGEIEELEEAAASIESEIRGRHPRRGELLADTPFDLGDLQDALETGTVVYDLVVGERRSYLFLIGRSRLASFELPPAAELEALARRYLELVSSPNLAARRASLLAAGGRLAEILFGPGLERLAGVRRLVFVGDGGLALLPLASLPVPGSTPAEPKFLVELLEIVQVPSLRMLAVLRRPRPPERRPAKGLALIGDPWYDARRWKGRLRLEEVPENEVRRRLTGAPPPFPIGRLPFAGLELERIAARGRGLSSLRAQGPEATRHLPLSPELGDFAIVHFSAHGDLDPGPPERSAIVLAELDLAGRQADGRLPPEDLADLGWRAELVVASSCDGAAGRRYRFEGVAGLARGFFYAGADRILASLWKVEGGATADLMDRFYQALLELRLPPGEALRRAQTGLLDKARAEGLPWRAPYYWSGFALVGDWRAFSLP